jgi:hypothetical protein
LAIGHTAKVYTERIDGKLIRKTSLSHFKFYIVDELTLESLAAKVDAQEKLIQAQAEKIGKLELQKAELGGIVLKTKEVAEKPTIPEELVERKKKKYKWAFPTFRLLGDPTLYIAAEAALDDTIIDKLLAISGQNVLVEQA